MIRKRNVEKAAIILAIGTILAKALGFVRELVVAYKFGMGSITDAFVLTNSIPSMIFVTVGTAVGINYIPYCQTLKTDRDKNQYTSNLLNVLIAILLMGCIMINLIPGIVLKLFAAGLSSETEKYAVRMLRIVVFSILPITLANLFQAYSQANGVFLTTALYGMISNAVIIAVTLFATKQTYWLLSVGTILSNTVGMFIALLGARNTGFYYYRILKPFDEHIKRLALLTMPLIAEDIASSMSILVDKNLASFLDSGTISGLGYAGTLSNIAGTMIAASIITVTFPTFSRWVAEGNREDFERGFGKYGECMLFIMCPISAVLIFFAQDIVVLIFEHGAFTNSNAQIVWESLACYAVGIVPSAMQAYFIRAFYVMQDTKTPVKIKVSALFCNIALNIASIRVFQHKGIALSTSVSMVMAYILLGHFLKRKYSMTSISDLTRKMVCGLIMAIIPGTLIFSLFRYYIEVKNIILRFALELGLFTALYLGMEIVFNLEGAKKFLDMLRRHISKS